jgi:hypothetical protein
MNKVRWFVFAEVTKAMRGQGRFELESSVTANMPSCLIPSAIKLMCDMRWYVLSLLSNYRDDNSGDGGDTNQCNLL